MGVDDRSMRFKRKPATFKAVAASAAFVCLLCGPLPVAAEPAGSARPPLVPSELVQKAGGEIYTFYAERKYRPLWFGESGTLSPAARSLLELVGTAEYDGLDPAGLGIADLKAALGAESSGASAADLGRIELLLSRTFVAYAQALRSSSASGIIYEHDSLRPQQASPYHLLRAAAQAPALDDYISRMGWMHPLYAPIRQGLTPAMAHDDPMRVIGMRNLARVRGIPTASRQIVVDIASARLWMYEDNRPVGSMRVVVGRPTTQTPFLAGYVRYAILNPYWNVPAELMRKNIAPNVLRRGPSYLAAGGYQVLSDWSDKPTVLDPREVDWKAAASGDLDLRVRQLPRQGNAMGKVKYEFPNAYDIYLHDTPEKGLMQKEARQFSAGCIRLEDAERLGRWLMQGQMPSGADSPETRVDLPRPVPIYLTYLTVQPDQGGLALASDPYDLDQAKRRSLAGGQFDSSPRIR